MSSQGEKDKEKKEESEKKPKKESTEPEPPNLVLEEKPAKNDLKKDNKEEEDLEKKKLRAQRFGIEGKFPISSQEELDKRKERFKDELAQIKEEKEKDKEERERSREKYNNKRYWRNDYDSRNRNYRDRDFHRRGGGRGRFNQYKRFRGERRSYWK